MKNTASEIDDKKRITTQTLFEMQVSLDIIKHFEETTSNQHPIQLLLSFV